MKKRFSEEQIVGILRESEAGVAIKQLCRKHGFSEASYYAWRSKYSDMEVSDVRRLKRLEAENARLKRLLAESLLENELTREALRKKMPTVPDHRVMVRWLQTKGLSQRRALEVVCMSATVLRYEPRPDRNIELRTSIVKLAQRHRRYGVGMIYLMLSQRGECVNDKRVERLYRLEKLQLQRRRRQKRGLTERHPLGRPSRRNEVWSMDFVFERKANGRTLEVFDRRRRCNLRIRGGHPGSQHG